MTEGLRERKKNETRRRLATAALTLVAADERGPDGVTVEAIAEAAGVSPRTFFNYFASKEDAIVGVPEAQPSELLAALVARPADEPPALALADCLIELADQMEASVDRWNLRRDLLARYPSLATRFTSRLAEVERSLVDEVARRADMDPDVDLHPALVVTSLMGATRVAMAVWQGRARPEPLVEVMRAAFAELGDGFGLGSALNLGSGPGATAGVVAADAPAATSTG